MGFELYRPLWLLAMPASVAAIVFIWRTMPARGLSGRAALAMRCLIALLLTIALAAPSLVTTSRESATWVLVDGSDSAKPMRAAVEEGLESALEGAPDDLMIGLIAFGAQPSVEAPLSAARRYPAASALDPSASRLSSALELAAALLPSETAGRIAVISDGRVDDIKDQAAMLGARGVVVDVLQVKPDEPRDAQVRSLSLPSVVREGQSLSVEVTIDANHETGAQLVLYANREPVAVRTVALRGGENRFVLQDIVKKAGVVTYEALLDAEGDARSENNRRAAYVRVEGSANCLVVEGKAGGARELRKLLDATGLRHDVIAPAQFPASAEALRTYDAVVLADVDADDLGAAQTAALDQAVRSLGRGLVVLGGATSYALGGYKGSALEKILPVTMDVKGALDMPSLALMLVIDKSGSMTDGQYGTPRIELAKEAAQRACLVLTERDSVGVIAFDDSAKWVSPLGLNEDAEAIGGAIGSIRPGGGTAFYAPLSEAYQALSAYDAPQKHIIFLTDGESADGGFEALVAAYAGEGVTLTTVAVGSGANAPLLARLAEIGGGRAYAAGEFDDLTKIFTKETYMAAGTYVKNRSFTPVVTERSALTDYPAFPALDGYLAATLKPLATQSLMSDLEEPILAHWRYGAGKALSWTSDAQGAWTSGLLAWSRAAEFFSGMVSHVLSETAQAGSLTAAVEGGALVIGYEQPPEADEVGLKTRAQVVLPDGGEETATLTETAPGVFEGRIPAGAQGAYALTVTQTSGGQPVRKIEGGAVSSYSGEYDLRADKNSGALEALAKETGGRVLSTPEELFTQRGAPVRARTDLTAWFIALALAAFLIDITMRRLGWPRARERKKAGKPSKKKTERKPEEPATPTAAPDTTDQLLAARRNRKKL